MDIQPQPNQQLHFEKVTMTPRAKIQIIALLNQLALAGEFSGTLTDGDQSFIFTTLDQIGVEEGIFEPGEVEAAVQESQRIHDVLTRTPQGLPVNPNSGLKYK
jgi:hypothetical protein